MTDTHLTAALLERWALGTLLPDEEAAVEAHAAACEACGAQLAAEAAFELRLAEVALAAPAPARRRRRVAIYAAAGLSLAAGVLVLVAAPFESPPPPEAAPRVVECDEPSQVTECVSRAHFDGLLTVVPGSALAVPRYDELPRDTKRGTP